MKKPILTEEQFSVLGKTVTVKTQGKTVECRIRCIQDNNTNNIYLQEIGQKTPFETTFSIEQLKINTTAIVNNKKTISDFTLEI